MDAQYIKYETEKQLRQQKNTTKRRKLALGPNKPIKPGRVFRVEGGQGFDGSYITVTGISAGFYFYVSDEQGRPPRNSRDVRIWHSNMFSQEDLYHHGDIRIKRVKKGRYEWYLTGYEHVDVLMSNLGGSYRYFKENAPEMLVTEYDRLTDRNDHTEAARIIYNFSNAKRS